MPWCPKCKTEHRPDFDTCSDCGNRLVDALPVETPRPTSKAARFAGDALYSLAAWLVCGPTVGFMLLGSWHVSDTDWMLPMAPVLVLCCTALLGFAAKSRLSLPAFAVGWTIPTLLALLYISITAPKDPDYATDIHPVLMARLIVIGYSLAGAAALLYCNRTRHRRTSPPHIHNS